MGKISKSYGYYVYTSKLSVHHNELLIFNPFEMKSIASIFLNSLNYTAIELDCRFLHSRVDNRTISAFRKLARAIDKSLKINDSQLDKFRSRIFRIDGNMINLFAAIDSFCRANETYRYYQVQNRDDSIIVYREKNERNNIFSNPQHWKLDSPVILEAKKIEVIYVSSLGCLIMSEDENNVALCPLLINDNPEEGEMAGYFKNQLHEKSYPIDYIQTD